MKTFADFMGYTTEYLIDRRSELDTMIIENTRMIDVLVQEGSSTIPLRIVEDRLRMEDIQIRIALKKMGSTLV